MTRTPNSVTSHVALSFEGPIPSTLLAEFQDVVAADGFELLVEQRPLTRAYAALEWLMPTAIVVYIAKSYFEGFLSEMGKDHYAALKQGVKMLQRRLSRTNAVPVGPGRNISKAQPYSLAYSIWFERNAETKFKFLVPADLDSESADAAMNEFLGFLERYHRGTLSVEEVGKLAGAQPIGRTVLLAFNSSSGMVDVVTLEDCRRN